MQSDIKGIALCGAPGSGKTSIANELAELLGWERLSFADPLKDDVADALTEALGASPGVERLRMQTVGTKDEYRPLLQAWGSFFRRRDPKYWVDAVREQIHPGGHYVIDDCRYRNEYEMLRERGFVFVLLQSGPTTRPLPPDQFDHESERDWPDFQYDVILDYEPGPRLQAVRICQKLVLRLAGSAVEMLFGSDMARIQTTFHQIIEDALPEDTQDDPGDAACEPECPCNNDACDGCRDCLDEDVQLVAAEYEEAGAEVSIVFPSGAVLRYRDPVIEDDEPVYAVPA